MLVWQGFVTWGWLYLMIAIGIYLVNYLKKNKGEVDDTTKGVIFAMIVLVFHVWEEWVVPGGFHWVYNIQHGSSAELASMYPMNKVTDMITNFGGELLGFFWLLGKKNFKNEAAIAVGLFSFFEVFIHVYITVLSVQEYGGLWYAPGLVTAVFGFLPAGIYQIRAVIKNHADWKAWAKGLLLLVAMSVIFVTLPEQILKSEVNVYGWTDHGYYNQFLK